MSINHPRLKDQIDAANSFSSYLMFKYIVLTSTNMPLDFFVPKKKTFVDLITEYSELFFQLRERRMYS